MALSQTPCPKSPSRRSKLRYAVLALMVAGVLKTCQNDTHDRVMAATDSSITAPRPKPRVPQVTRVAPPAAPEEDTGYESAPLESASLERRLSFADPNLEVFMRLQECAPEQDWNCTLQLSSVEPFWVYPAYAHPALGSPFELRTQSRRPIVCTLNDVEDFSTYIAVDPWSTQVDISNDPTPTAYFGPTPFLQGPADPCDALSIYRERLLDTADLHLDISHELLLELGFEEVTDETSYCFTQSFFYPVETEDRPIPFDTADTGAREEAPPEDEEVLRICLSENALWFTYDFSLNGAPWEDAFSTSVNHPERFVETIAQELDFLLNEETDTATE